MKILMTCMFITLLLSSCGQENKVKENKKKAEGVTPSSSLSNRNSSYDAGKLVYDRNCKVCHQVNRKGIPKIYPPLKDTESIKGDKTYLIDVVLNGQSEEIVVEGVKYKGVMASYRNLKDQDIADVLNYLRNDSEAASDIITPEDVKQAR
ncbi:c-type cytochrome [Labilibacter marinus]|uniref:c-type cytochrome n=1 Tax=Labilibacter marinus TaxID=1477105 RepID=UPI000831220D|nr:cytochrome c [Labilibacter marinus]